MAVLEGGIFSNPRGKTGGIVFGAARTRTGKKVTSRLLVPPSNPNTALQQAQRGKFASALAMVRLIGSTIYQSDWNRAIGQLPGFQSLTSIFLNAMEDDEVLGAIPEINLGSLHLPDTIALAAGGGSGEMDVTWSEELGVNGTLADVAVVIGIRTEWSGAPLSRNVDVDTTATRDDGAAGVTLSGFGAGAGVTVGVYFRGAGTADGLLSNAAFNAEDTT